MTKRLQSFSFDKCDLDTLVDNIGFFMRGATVNIDKRNTKPIPKICYLLSGISVICYYYAYFFSVIWYLCVKYPQNRDYVAAIIMFSQGTITETCALKLIFVKLNRKLILNVVERYLICDSQVEKGTRFANNIKKHLRTVKKRATTIWLLLVINAYVHLLLPYFRPGRHFPEDSFILYGLEPKTETPYFEISTAIFTVTIPAGVYILATVTALMVVLFGYTEAQIVALSEELLNIWPDAQKYISEIQSDVDEALAMNLYIAERLKFIVKLHNESITLLKSIESVLRLSMALEFLFLMMGVIATLLGGLENTHLQLPFAVSQIYMNCFLGQRIIDASKMFEKAVYFCQWENFNKSNMKTVLIILQNSQKTLKLSAGGIAILSFECLMSVIKSCYSFYTTLRSTLKS